MDDSGNVFISDNGNNTVRKVNPSGIISRFAGNGLTYGPFGEGGPATAACIASANGIATDATGNVYISTGGQVRKIDKSNIITTVAGNGSLSGGDGGPATAAGLNRCQGLAVDKSGNVYIADYGNNKVRKINSSGIISTIAGNGTVGYSGDGLIATNAELNQPTDVAVDASGNVYIADYSNFVVRKVNTAGIISTFAGDGTFSHKGDGSPATSAGFVYPFGVCVDASGNVYISEEGDVRVVNSSGIINDYAGSYPGGSTAGDGGPAQSAQLLMPQQMDVDICGNLYIADYGNDNVRKVSGISGGTNICTGSNTPFVPVSPGGTWSSSALAVASVSAAGMVNAITPGTSIIIYTIGVISAITTVTVSPAPVAGTLTGPPYICVYSSTVLVSSAPSGVWTHHSASLDMEDSLITGHDAGWDTVRYTVTTGCGTARTVFPILVVNLSQCDSMEHLYVSASPALSETLQLYPNPSKGSFTILLSSGTDEQVPVIITNIMGEKVGELVINSNKENTINLNQPAGIYFISINTTKKRYTQQITIE